MTDFTSTSPASAGRFDHVPAVSIAPMMKRTDRHFRYMMRLLSRRTLLYTEMVNSGAVVHGDRDWLLGFDPSEHPIALQLGGDDPGEMAEAARIAQDYGYDEVNINVGCPSSRVQEGNFGVCLMGQPDVVARCVEAMRQAVDIPVTVKHRIGFDDRDSYDDMVGFVRVVRQAGCQRFTVHARKAWLQGLSPKENRNVPPLRYDDVYRLKDDHPELWVEINGGIKTIADMQDHLRRVDAVMLGRAAYDTPYIFADVDRVIFGEDTDAPSRREVVEAMCDYADRWVARGGKLQNVTRHMLELYSHQPGARRWRRHLTEQSHRDGADSRVLREALALVEGTRAPGDGSGAGEAA